MRNLSETLEWDLKPRIECKWPAGMTYTVSSKLSILKWNWREKNLRRGKTSEENSENKIWKTGMGYRKQRKGIKAVIGSWKRGRCIKGETCRKTKKVRHKETRRMWSKKCKWGLSNGVVSQVRKSEINFASHWNQPNKYKPITYTRIFESLFLM